MPQRATLAALNTILDSGIDTVLNNAIVEARSGAQPSAASAAPTGTLLWTKTLPADAVAAAVAGVKQKNGTWSANGSATGVAGWFRIKLSTDTAAVTETQFRIDGQITLPGNGGQMTASDLNIVSGVAWEILTCSISLASL